MSGGGRPGGAGRGGPDGQGRAGSRGRAAGPRSRRGGPARGESPLSITAPAFSERRSCLPQLDCERPRGRDPDSHFFGIRPTFMCYVPSPVLASVGDTGERQAAGTRVPAPPVGTSSVALTHPLTRR